MPFVKGHKPYMATLGMKMTDEQRKKLSVAKTGIKLPPFTEEHKKKIGLGNTRPNSEYHRFMKTKKSASRPKPEQCEICGAMGTIVFDHDHKTDLFRGWICNRCNLALGLVKDNTETLMAMINYLKQNGTSN